MIQVAIIVDPSYGEFQPLLSKMPIWVVDTSHNQERLARTPQEGKTDAWGGATTFKVRDVASREANLAGILATVDLHHGIYSSGEPMHEVFVYGVSITEELRLAFEELDFTVFEPTSDGFIARVA